MWEEVGGVLERIRWSGCFRELTLLRINLSGSLDRPVHNTQYVGHSGEQEGTQRSFLWLEFTFPPRPGT